MKDRLSHIISLNTGKIYGVWYSRMEVYGIIFAICLNVFKTPKCLSSFKVL